MMMKGARDAYVSDPDKFFYFINNYLQLCIVRWQPEGTWRSPWFFFLFYITLLYAKKYYMFPISLIKREEMTDYVFFEMLLRL